MRPSVSAAAHTGCNAVKSANTRAEAQNIIEARSVEHKRLRIDHAAADAALRAGLALGARAPSAEWHKPKRRKSM